MRLPQLGHHATVTMDQTYELIGVEATQRLVLWALRLQLQYTRGFGRTGAEHLLFVRWIAFRRRLIGS